MKKENEDVVTLKKEKEIKIFTQEEAVKSATAYFRGDDLAGQVWVNKYALKDSEGNVYEDTPKMMHDRLANEIHRIEQKYPNPLDLEEIKELIYDFKYLIPQGGPMSGIGNNYQTTSLSNCFVIGDPFKSDSYGGIMKVDEEQVHLMKRRGGVGHDLSHIRPKGSPVKNSALTSTGVVPFMERYSNSTREVAQDGRRGALMLSLDSKHPDVESFVDAKMDSTKVTGANVSVRIHDDFMEAVKKDSSYTLQYPIDSDNPKYTKNIEAKKLWDKMMHNAWKSAEPGILFWDKVISESLPDRYADLGYETVSTNPCGEIPLCPDDSCRLLAINLLSYVVNPFTPDAYFDFDLFKKHSRYALRFMDNIVDLEIEKIDRIIEKIDNDPEPEHIKRNEKELWIRIQKKCKEGRRTGVGITAEGDMLAALGYRYGTKKATDFAEKVHMNYAIEVYRSSNELAKERGAFGIFDAKREKDAPFLLRIKEQDEKLYKSLMKHGRRNIACLTIAPTGTTSLMTQTTSGIEPTFMVAYKRRRKVNPNDKNARTDYVDEVGDHWEEYNVFHHGFEKWIKAYGHKYLAKDEKDIPLSLLSEETVDMLTKKSPYHKAMANDVDWVEKVRMQGNIQKWVDHSISVTVNLPENVTEELVNDVYMTAWKYGCKGCTIYRDGSRSGVLVSKDEKKKEEIFEDVNAPRRPEKLECTVMNFQNKGEKWIGFLGLMNNRPYEIFTGALENFPIPGYVDKGLIQKIRGEEGSVYNFIYMDKNNNEITIPNLNYAFDERYYDSAKTFSAILRHGMPINYVVKLIDSLNLDGDLITTWKAGVKRMLKRFIKDGKSVGEKCEECGSEELEYIEGCLTCRGCGHGKCG